MTEYFLATLFIIICILLIIVVLLQKGRGGGLGAAFGGSGSSAFGTKTGDVFTWVTIVLTALFLTLAVVTTLVYRPAPPVSPQFHAVADEPNAVEIATIATGDTIYYTIDGSDPKKSDKKNKQSMLYAGKFTVTPGTTVKAVRYIGSTPSTIVSAKYPLAGTASRPAMTTSMPAEASATKPATSAPASIPTSATATSAIGK